MTMYEKLTPEKFVENMKSDKYANLTGARRAIGKVDWAKKDKERAHELADKHFGTSGATTKPAKAPKAAKKVKTAAVKSPSVAKTKGRRTFASPQVSSLEPMDRGESDDVKKINMAEQVIGAASKAIQAMAHAKQTDPNIDITEMQDSVNAMNTSIRQMVTVFESKGGSVPSRVKNGVTLSQLASSSPLSDEQRREHELFERARAGSTQGPGSIS